MELFPLQLCVLPSKISGSSAYMAKPTWNVRKCGDSLGISQCIMMDSIAFHTPTSVQLCSYETAAEHVYEGI